MDSKASGRWGLLKAAAIWLLLGTRAVAQTVGVSIESPPHGAAIEQSSPFYDPATQRVLVSGAVGGVNAGNMINFLLLVQGGNTPMTIQPSGAVTFQTWVAVGPDPPPGLAYWPSWYPYLPFFLDIDHIQKPIIAELYDIAQARVVGRSRITLFDKRWDGALRHDYPASPIESAVAFELTTTGLDKLERTHVSSMPQPSAAAFNSLLTSNFTGLLQTYAPETRIGRNDKACIPLTQADPAFLTLGAYNAPITGALSQASLQFLLYQYAKNNPSNPGSQACLTDCCVRSLPQADDFELCVGTLEGTSDRLSLASVAGANLQIGANPIEAQVALNGLHGTVDGRLRDLFIRYRQRESKCTMVPRPQRSIDNADLTGSLATWTSCPGLGLTAQRPSTQDWLTFTLGQDPASSERNLVQASNLPVPIFRLGVNRNESPNQGQCGRPELRAHVVTLLQMFYDRMQSALDASWRHNHPNTQQALALDKLFSRWEPGIFGDLVLRDHTLKLEFPPGLMTYSGWPMGFLADRLYASLSSDVQAAPSALVVPPPTSFVYSRQGSYPCLDIMSTPCQPGRNFFGDPFDVSYSVTTGALNQVLAQLSSTDWLRFPFRPTYEQLNLTPPPRARPTDRPVLDGPLLSQWFSAFSDLGSTRVSIYLQPTLLPFTWINPDPQAVPPVPPGRASLTYQMSQYLVDFVGDQKGPNGSYLWLRVLVDFYDPDFQLSLHPTPRTNLLQPALSGSQQWTYTLLESQLGSCPYSPMTMYPPPPPIVFNPCGGDLAAKVGDLVRPVLEEKLLGMLSRYPAPLRYDAAGAASAVKQLIQSDKYQWGQVITFYGLLQ